MFRPIYRECEILLLRLEEGLLTEKTGIRGGEKNSVGSVKTLPVLNLDTDLVVDQVQ